MAKFQQTLQSQPSPVAPVQEPSATAAVGSVLEGVFDTLSNMSEQSAKAKEKQRQALVETTAADYANQLASGWSDRSSSPTKAKQWINGEVAKLRGELDPRTLRDVSENFFKLTGERVLGGQVDAMKDQSEVERVQREKQQQITTDLAYAQRYRGQDESLSAMFTDTGELREGVTPEQVAAAGRAVRFQQEANLAVLQNQAETAKSESERILAQQKIAEARVTPELVAEMGDFIGTLKGKPIGEAVQSLDNQYASITSSLQTLPLSSEGKKRIGDSLEIVYNNTRAGLTGARDQQGRADVNAVETMRIFNAANENNPSVRVMMALKAAGVPPSETTTKAAEAGIANTIRKMSEVGPNTPAPPQGASPEASPEQSSQAADVYRRNVTDAWVFFATPDKPAETPQQQKALVEHLTLGLNPVNAEQRRNFFGRNGVYIDSIQKWASNPSYLSNMGPTVLNDPDVKEAFERNNQAALASYIQGAMSQSASGFNLPDYIKVDDSGDYPKLVVSAEAPRGGGSRFARPAEGVRSPLYESVDKLNQLFKLQYESSVNYGDVIGDESMGSDMKASQMRALANYIKEDTALGSLKSR